MSQYEHVVRWMPACAGMTCFLGWVMMRKFFLVFLLLLPLPALAEPTLGIVATVNDDAITTSDLSSRTRLMLLGSGIQPSPEILSHLQQQVLRTLIDEHLQMQEAKQLNITVSDTEIDEQVAKLAEQNHMPAAQLPDFFARGGVPISTLRDQMRASIAWGKVVQRKLRPQVDIGEDEVDAEITRLEANAGKPEYLIADIFLPVDSPQQEQSVQQSANKLIDTMAHGARFSGIARQFSQSASAAAGGDLGWLQPGQLEPQLDEAIRNMHPGTLSPPVRTATGYHILMLRDMRLTPGAAAPADPAQTTFNLRQVMIPLAGSASGSEVTAASSKLEEMQKQAKSCTDMERFAAAQGDSKRGDLGDIKYPDLPPALQQMISALPDNIPSPSLRNEHGVLFLMVCSRQAPAGATAGVDRSQIMNRIGGQKLELLARRYLRDLRQNAFIDVRG